MFFCVIKGYIEFSVWANCLKKGYLEVNEIEQNALDFFKDGAYEKAAKLYLQLAVASPDNENYLITAANCYDKIGDKKLALSLYKKALAVNPNSMAALLNISTLYYELKRFEQAGEYARKALEQKEDNFAALMNMGNSLYSRGEYAEALKYYEKLYQMNPNSYNALLNIANTCYSTGQYLRAIEYAQTAIEKRPTSAEPYIIAGNAFIELSKAAEASSMLKKASELAPNSSWLCNSLANLFRKMGNWKQCLHFAWKVFALKGDRVNADEHINFGYLLYEAYDEKQEELAKKYMERWKEAFPDNPIVKHVSCAIGNIQEVDTTDLSYVKGLFDGFASSFDEILKDLDYQVPDLIAEFLKDTLKVKLFKKRQILDLGCGTGLCGAAVKAYFPNEEFYGVDVSEKMLEVAGLKNIYKELYFDDIINFLGDAEEPYHAVIAGDVLTYMGELKTFFRLLIKALKPNGLFCFSVSKNVYNQSDYFLVPSGRFVHSITYVLRLLKYYGFEVLRQEECVLRHEGANDVQGYVILARKEIEVVFE